MVPLESKSIGVVGRDDCRLKGCLPDRIRRGWRAIPPSWLPSRWAVTGAEVVHHRGAARQIHRRIFVVRLGDSCNPRSAHVPNRTADGWLSALEGAARRGWRASPTVLRG